MSWIKKYQIPFQSFLGTQYMVYIYEQGDTQGSVTTLTGAAEPFATQEDDDTDIFTPIRKQTGYLRIIDESGGTMLEQLIPHNSTEKMLRLYTGTWNSNFTVFTDGEVKWQGFLAAEVYTQPWDGQKNMLEFPINSILATTDYAEADTNMAGTVTTIAQFIVKALIDTCSDESPIDSVTLIDDCWAWLTMYLNWDLFFNPTELEDDENTITQLEGETYFKILEEIAKTTGLTFREQGRHLYIARYDTMPPNDDDLPITATQMMTWTFANFKALATGSTVLTSWETLPDVALLNSISFRGADNALGFHLGANKAVVKLNISYNNVSFQLPQAKEEDSAVISFLVNNNNQYVFVQRHQRTNIRETYTYCEFTDYHFEGYSTANDLWSYFVSRTTAPDPNPYGSDHILLTGAIPVRWYFTQDYLSPIKLKNGLLFLTQYQTQSQVTAGDFPSKYPLYSIKGTSSYTLDNGWLNVDLDMNTFCYRMLGSDWLKLFPDYGEGYTINTELYCALRVGNKYFDRNSGWVEGGNPQDNNFVITFTNNRLDANNAIYTGLDKSTGYFIPAIGLSGDIEFFILNIAIIKLGSGFAANGYAHIASNISVEFLRAASITSTSNGENTYYKKIVDKGFKESKETQLLIGTFNNNVPSSSFIQNNNHNYVTTFPYQTLADTVVNERPEVHLLNRMVQHFSEVRRTFKGIIQSGIDLMTTRYTYLNRRFFAVDANHNWRDDEQEVKFIEVS